MSEENAEASRSAAPRADGLGRRLGQRSGEFGEEGPISTDLERLFVGPVAFDELPVPAVGLAAAGGDDLEAVRPQFEAAANLRRDADHVQLLDFDNLVFKLNASR